VLSLILAQRRRILDGCQLEKIIGVQSTRLAVNTDQYPFHRMNFLGHTMLVDVEAIGQYKILGESLDDAVALFSRLQARL
jgi:hypothetical protein